MNYLQGGLLTLAISSASILLFFFITTRVSISLHSSSNYSCMRHVYWIYRSPFLIWLTDRPWIVSAVLLLQYNKLCDAILETFTQVPLEKRRVLQIASVSGNITERLAFQFLGKADVTVFDITRAGIENTEKKLIKTRAKTNVMLFQADATAIPMKDSSFDCVLSFFLFHELPSMRKQKVLDESLRVLRPGGIFSYVEFHKPNSFILRLLGKTIFSIFEPYAKEMWRWSPRIDVSMFEIKKQLFFYNYFQIVSVKRR